MLAHIDLLQDLCCYMDRETHVDLLNAPWYSSSSLSKGCFFFLLTPSFTFSPLGPHNAELVLPSFRAPFTVEEENIGAGVCVKWLMTFSSRHTTAAAAAAAALCQTCDEYSFN